MSKKSPFNQFLRDVKNRIYPNRIEARYYREFRTLHGIKIRCSHAPIMRSGVWRGFGTGGYEAAERELVSKLLKKDDTVLEIGGGCGFISSFIWKKGLATKIHVVEASPEMIEVIRDTHQLNNVQAELHHEILVH